MLNTKNILNKHRNKTLKQQTQTRTNAIIKI